MDPRPDILQKRIENRNAIFTNKIKLQPSSCSSLKHREGWKRKRAENPIRFGEPEYRGPQSPRDRLQLHPKWYAVIKYFFIISDFVNQLIDSNLATNLKIKSLTYNWQRSQFFNNKQLGDEECYIINRKTAKPLPGNFLEKPQLLLNRSVTQATKSAKEELKKGSQH